MHRWLNTCCQTCVTSRSLCPSRRDTSPTALNTCNVDTTLKKLPRWSLLKSKPFFGPARHLHPVTTCLLRSHPEAPRNKAFHPGLPPCACTIPLTHACMSVRVRFCGCEVHPHIFLLSQLLASSAIKKQVYTSDRGPKFENVGHGLYEHQLEASKASPLPS